MDGINIGDEIADGHDVQRGKRQLVGGVKCLEAIPTS